MTKKKLLLTGHTGFVGSHLIKNKSSGDPAYQAYELAVPPENFDVRLQEHWQQLITGAEPDYILHLAAQSHVPTSIADPCSTIQTNVTGTAALLQVLKQERFKGRLLYISSADVYGKTPPENLPICEDQQLAPRNPYAVSKTAAEALCRQFHWTENLDIVIARPFNHTGAGQKPDFALSGFAKTIAQIALQIAPARIEVGDIDVSRDFSNVSDVLHAYLLLLQQGVSGETYNICSGQETVLRQALTTLLQLAGVAAEISVDRTRIRAGEQRRVCGNNEKLISTTGWTPIRTLQDTLQELFDYWKKELE